MLDLLLTTLTFELFGKIMCAHHLDMIRHGVTLSFFWAKMTVTGFFEEGVLSLPDP